MLGLEPEFISLETALPSPASKTNNYSIAVFDKISI